MSLHLPEDVRGEETHRVAESEREVGRRVGACPAAVFSSEVEQLREQLAEALVEAEQQRIRAEAAEAELRELRADCERRDFVPYGFTRPKAFPADFVPGGYIVLNNRGGVAETLPGTPSASDAAAISPQEPQA